MIGFNQIFECVLCGYAIEAHTEHDCDQLEGSRCDRCDEGYLQWAGPTGMTQGNDLEPESLFDDVENDLDEVFERITVDEIK